MYYCKACRRLEEINRCGVCGAKNLPFPGAGDFCFVEDQPLASVVERLEEIILFKWNRVYPADTYFDISLDDWRCVSAIDFAGSSHETITQEVYCR